MKDQVVHSKRILPNAGIPVAALEHRRERVLVAQLVGSRLEEGTKWRRSDDGGDDAVEESKSR